MANVSKYVGESRVFTFDFSFYPEIAVNGEVITSASAVAVPAEDLSLGTPSITSPKVFIRIEDGTAGVSYNIYVSAVTDGGNTIIMNATLPVRSNGG